MEAGNFIMASHPGQKKSVIMTSFFDSIIQIGKKSFGPIWPTSSILEAPRLGTMRGLSRSHRPSLGTVLFLATHIEYKSIDASVFAISNLGWSFIPMIMSVHVSFVIAGTVPVGDMHLSASTTRKRIRRLLLFPDNEKTCAPLFLDISHREDSSEQRPPTSGVIVCRWLGVPCSGVAILTL